METALEQPRLDPDVKPTSWEDKMGLWHSTPTGDLLVTPLVTEDMLAAFFLRLKAEDLHARVFHENPYGATLGWYLQYYQRDVNLTLACFREGPETKKLIPHGMAWIVAKTPVGGTLEPLCYKAECGIGVYRGTSPRNTIHFGQMTIQWAFEKLGIAALYGCIPAPNKASIRYAKALGFTLHGPMPSYTAWTNEQTGQREAVDGYVGTISREEWEERRENVCLAETQQAPSNQCAGMLSY